MQYFTRTLKVLLSAQPTADRLAIEPQLAELGFPDTEFLRPVPQSQVHRLMWQLSQRLGYFSNARLLSSPLSLSLISTCLNPDKWSGPQVVSLKTLIFCNSNYILPLAELCGDRLIPKHFSSIW